MTDKETDKNVIGKGKAGPGRPLGSLNKTTGLLKDAILEAATAAGDALADEMEQEDPTTVHKRGMICYLKKQALDNPGPFLGLLGKVLPTQIGTDPDAPVPSFIIQLVRPNADREN